MRILLVLNKPNREIPIMESIKREILALRPDAEVEIREMCTPGFKRFVFKFRPEVIMTFPFTCVGFSRWYYLYKLFLGTKIISFRAEGVIDFSNEHNIEWAAGFDSYGKSLVDYEVFWGEKVASVVGNILLEQNKLSSLDRIKVFGYPRLEKYFSSRIQSKPVLPKRIADRLTGYSKEKVILFITGFHLANYTKQNLFDAKDLDAENRLDQLLEAVEISKQFRADWVRNVIDTARKNPDLLFVSKKHPIEKREDYSALETIENVLFIYEDIEVHDIIPYAGLFFHYGSTALVDAYLSEIPAVYIYSKKNKEWYSDLGWPASARVAVDEMASIIRKYLSGDVAFERTTAVKQILKDIFNIEEDKPYNPSREIAKLLLGSDKAQRVPLSDWFLWKALLAGSINSVIFAAARTVKRVLHISPDAPLFQKRK